MISELLIGIAIIGALALVIYWSSSSTGYRPDSWVPMKNDNTPYNAYERNLYSNGNSGVYWSPYQARSYNCGGCDVSSMKAITPYSHYDPSDGKINRAEVEPYGLITQDATRVMQKQDYYAINPFGRVTDMALPSRSHAQVMETVRR